MFNSRAIQAKNNLHEDKVIKILMKIEWRNKITPGEKTINKGKSPSTGHEPVSLILAYLILMNWCRSTKDFDSFRRSETLLFIIWANAGMIDCIEVILLSGIRFTINFNTNFFLKKSIFLNEKKFESGFYLAGG